MTPSERLGASLRSPRRPGAAVLAHLVAGYPSRTAFPGVLARVSELVDAVAIAVPTPAPLADGAALGRAMDEALAEGATLRTVLDELARHRPRCPALLVCPLAMARSLSSAGPAAGAGPGPARLVRELALLGIDGLLMPDLPPGTRLRAPPARVARPARLPPPERRVRYRRVRRSRAGHLPQDDLEALLSAVTGAGVALGRLVTPDTPDDPLPAERRAAGGLLWVASTAGIGGGALDVDGAVALLARIRPHAAAPVCAAVGVRRPDQARRIALHADGVVVGSALVDGISQGRDPGDLLDAIRAAVTR